MKTTLNKIREHNPCAEGWEKLLKYLGKTKPDDEEISVLTILDSNGIDDAIWCLRAVEGYDRELRLFAVWCARQVQHLMTDQRSLDALDVAERYANGEATDAELKDAWKAAWAVVGAAWVARKGAAWDAEAALDAAWADAWRAAGYAARSAAWSAALDAAARSATMSDAWDVAWDVAKAKQETELRRICEEG